MNLSERQMLWCALMWSWSKRERTRFIFCFFFLYSQMCNPPRQTHTFTIQNECNFQFAYVPNMKLLNEFSVAAIFILVHVCVCLIHLWNVDRQNFDQFAFLFRFYSIFSLLFCGNNLPTIQCNIFIRFCRNIHWAKVAPQHIKKKKEQKRKNTPR